MTKAEKHEAIFEEKKVFGLKNYWDVKARYNNRWKKYSEVIKDYTIHPEAILCRLSNDYARFDMYSKILVEAHKTGKKMKSALNMIKRWVNETTYRMNAKLFTEANTTKWNYATKLYLAHYSEINEAMEKAFEEIVYDYMIDLSES